MKSVVQRVTHAEVRVGGDVVGQIEQGVVVLLSIAPGDTVEAADAFVRKLRSLAIFADKTGRMARTIEEVGGSVLLVSQFTLHADLSKGKRPSFSRVARPEQAQELVDAVGDELRQAGIHVETGQFGAHMQLELVNDGPATFLLDVVE